MKFSSRSKINKVKISVAFGGFVVMTISLFAAFVAVSNWFDEHEVIFQRVIEVKTQSPIRIEKREMVSPIVVYKTVEEMVQDSPDVKRAKRIVELWGGKNAAKALAVAKAESGFDCNRFNVNSNNTVDLSIFQVNSLWMKNYPLEEIANCDRNIEIAYEIWDRADGVVGNGEGDFTPWVAYQNEGYLKVMR